ncbi:sugar phosphate isomerase/epimerase family protein [Salinispira pacifica]
MKLGLSTYAASWAIGVGAAVPPSPLDHFSFLRLAAGMGFRLVQIADNLPLDRLSPDERRQLRDFADSLGVEVEVGTRGLTPENLADYLAIAREFESPILRIVIDRADYRPPIDAIISTLKSFQHRLEDEGVILAIENHDRFTCGEFAGMIRAVDSPAVRICLDTVNSFGALEGPEVVIDALGPLTANLHLKDFTIERVSHQMGFVVEGAPAGAGRLDIPNLLSQLRGFGTDPNAILELWVPPEATREQTIDKEAAWRRQSVDYLRRLIPD